MVLLLSPSVTGIDRTVLRTAKHRSRKCDTRIFVSYGFYGCRRTSCKLTYVFPLLIGRCTLCLR